MKEVKFEGSVLKNNGQKLKDRGFIFAQGDVSELPSFWEGETPTIGHVDTQDESGYKKLTVSPIPANNCPGNFSENKERFKSRKIPLGCGLPQT